MTLLASFLASWKLLDGRERSQVVLLVIVGLVANALDILIIFLAGLFAAATVQVPEEGLAGALAPMLLRDPAGSVLMLMALFAVRAATTLLSNWWRPIFLTKVEVKNAELVSQFIFSTNFETFRNFSKSYIEWTVLRSTNIAFSIVLGNGILLFTELFMTFSVAVIFILTDWVVGLSVIFYFSIIMIFFHLLSRVAVIRAGEIHASSYVEASDTVSDISALLKELRVSNRTSFFLEKFVLKREQVARATARITFLQQLARTALELGVLLGALALLSLLILGLVDFGDPLVLLVFLLGSFRLMTAILPIQRAVMQLKYDGPAARDAQDLVRESLEALRQPVGQTTILTQETENLAPKAVHVSVVALHYSFPGAKQKVPALKNLSLSANPGEFVAIIGPSGAGKSTLLNCILGLYVSQEGEILLDGETPAEFMERNPGAVAYVPQRTELIGGSIRDNVALGVDSLLFTDEAVWKALEAAGAETFVRSLPGQLDADVGLQKDSLSGGQIQRLGLARAILLKPRLLVLDEPTSGLDSQAELEISLSLRDLPFDCTRIVIAHQLSTIKWATNIVVVESGEITEIGDFKTLKEKSGFVQDYVRNSGL